MSDCCGCEIDTRALQAKQRRVLLGVLAINVVTFGMMVAAALLSGSSSLLSGTLDNLGDALTYGLSFLVVTHDISVGRKTDRIVRMLDGTVVEEQQLEVPHVLAGHAA